ncbi:C4-dicarboxylate ABC transporter [Brevundimonas sp. LM2]|uniref:intermembrane phospholipid transport protein YdbH family protein n=1 Tax=Brevundimonas sp. LM2 TaxID=1938605 RepID=UPI000983924D|nr:YdbH domain-containing protein [Brevundimonas sp. LM2]AQR60844.1 C4-dicarboxylate ABC transporter [Brevundimonas sp. LM2]
MTDTPAQPPRETPRGPRRRLAARVAAGLLILLMLVAGVAWLNRRAAAREVLVGWLDRRGIEADVTIQRLELTGFVGRVRIGDASNPDVTVERVEVDYALGLPWSRQGLGVTPSRIRLVRPVVRASWKAGKLSLGSLDPLVEEFTGRPARPDSRGPLMLVEGGRLRLDTEYGPLSLLGDARIDDGQLMRLSARMPAAALKSGATEARGLGGRLELTTTGDRMAVSTDLAAEGLTLAGAEGQGLSLKATGNLPYPDLKTRRGDGRAVLDLALKGRRMTVGDVSTTNADLTLRLNGAVTGWIETFGFTGSSDARLTAGHFASPALSAQNATVVTTAARLNLARSGQGLDARFEGPATLTAAAGRAADFDLTRVALSAPKLTVATRNGRTTAGGSVQASLGRFAFDTLSLDAVSGRMALDYVSDRTEALVLTGGVSARDGRWPLFGPVGPEDVPELAGMKRALGAFTLQATSVRVGSGAAGLAIALTAPARLLPANGGVLTLNPVARPVFAAAPGQRGGGALTLTATRGQGLPDATFAVPDWRLTAGGFQATLDGRAALDFGLARGLTVRTRGVLATNAGRLTYTAQGCLPLTLARLDLEENDVIDVSGRLCPTAGPLVVSQDGRWRATGRIEGIAASAPFLALAFAEATGSVVATGAASGLGLEATIASVSIDDTTRPRRFNTLTGSGSARLADEQWAGSFDLARSGNILGRMTLAHDGLSGTGGVVIDAPSLVFAEGGLQPADLSPLVQDIIRPPATGSAAFTGRIDWREDLPEGSSSGRLVVPGLDFVSPAGPVKGLSGTIDFTRLDPLTTAPGQSLKIATLESIAPLTDMTLAFQLDEAAVAISGGRINAAGGTVSIEPFSLPLDGRPFSGVIVLDRVQLGDLIAGSGFGDKVKLDAVVSGRLPFTRDPQTGVRIVAGSLFAAQPGRLSIQRTALSDLEAGGGGAVPPNTVEDLAYQAMENLAFDVLTADVNSLDEGRVGVLFRIRGRHDPPQRQELRLTLAELISREFLNRPLPLPSNTGIDLTLDTTLNLNQLVSDLLAINRARSGGDTPSDAPNETQP